MTVAPDDAIPQSGDDWRAVIRQLADWPARSGPTSRRQAAHADTRCVQMSWMFPKVEGSPMSARAQADQAASDLKYLEHREAELVRRLTVLGERHAFFPNEVSERQVDELARKLDELRQQIDSVRAQLPASRAQ
jgi:hypothetical protein